MAKDTSKVQDPKDVHDLDTDEKPHNSPDLDKRLGKPNSAPPPNEDRRENKLDLGDEKPRFRENWWQIWRPRDPPPPPPTSLASAPVIPLATSSLLSVLTYTWITPMMVLGYQRPLQATDLWKMDTKSEAAVLSKKLDAAWARRLTKSQEWNAKVKSGKIKPSFARRSTWAVKAVTGIPKAGWRKTYSKYQDAWGTREPSLAWALNDTFGWHFWLGGVAKVIGDTSQLMGPVLAKAIINFGKAHYAATVAGEDPPSFGPGVAMAIGLFCITVLASVMQHQFFWRSMSTGVLARAALIASIYKRGVSIAPRARAAHPSSSLVNHISTDVSRVDACAQWFHACWTAPIQVTVCLIILLVQLGPSALAGFSLFLIMTPLQERAMAYQFSIRQKSMKWTDQRAKLVQELLGAMRVVKWFTYEPAFLKRVGHIRNMELKGIWRILLIRAGNQAVAFSIPVLAAVLAFVTYSLSGNPFDSAIIFSSLSLFQLLRQPLMFLPRALSAISDAQSALLRLKGVFHAELLEGATFEVDTSLDVALRVEHASFEWEESENPEEKTKKKKTKSSAEIEAVKDEKTVPQAPFTVQDLNMTVPRGQLCAIVGPVGSGKSSLLLGLIGEMRRTRGSSAFGGSVAYCAQSAWIQNATLRDNILFGQPYDQDKYWRAIQDASLIPDLEVLPDGDLTEIGEKGINLSGGQKQRVNIARALYYDADIVLFDDPLSAVDAHVGKALFANAILGALKARGKTVILVTHALHFLPQVDLIYSLVNGRIAERGTYTELVERDGPFSKLVAEFGGKGNRHEEEENATKGQEKSKEGERKIRYETLSRAAGTGKVEGRLMKAEKRTIGSVSLQVYTSYLQAGKGIYTLPIILVTALLMQTSQVVNTYTLVWWQGNSFGWSQNLYMILYACLGISQAFFTFALGAAMSWMSILASENLHWDSTQRIFHAPMSVFDTTPLGRMLSVLGKDIDVMDNQLSEALRMFVVIISGVIGSVVVIAIVEHYFLIAVVFIVLGYLYFAAFYRSSARELKRLDANLRSLLYSHFSESLSGLATIRAYREVPRFLSDNEYYCDLEDRALYLTITNQRWLAVRLDFLGATMVFVVALLAVFGVNGINPAQIGLVLTYTTSLTQMFGMVTRQSAEVENYMNSVERVVHYSRNDLIEQEAPHENSDTKPPNEWPSGGSIDFQNVVMSYRPGLPAVLKNISLNIEPGEKVGVVGRTGAGKSSLMIALFRLVELDSGHIFIDGVDISTLGLRDLRSKIAIIPQDPLLFSGTIRSNLDPFSLYDDARLWDSLRRSYLVESPANDLGKKEKAEMDFYSGTQTPTSRFNLGTIIESEGSNLSVGERSLLSLARALVKDSKVIVLDEATASVDLETDSKIQHTIQTEFADRTLLCIAHRLRTILSYDRIMVLEAGQIVEFGTPIDLFLNEDGIFRGMCMKSNITREDIENVKE